MDIHLAIGGTAESIRLDSRLPACASDASRECRARGAVGQSPRSDHCVIVIPVFRAATLQGAALLSRKVALGERAPCAISMASVLVMPVFALALGDVAFVQGYMRCICGEKALVLQLKNR